VTEYGVADLRGKSDRDVIVAMRAITDQRFQDDLLLQAKDAGKIERSFELPNTARDNTPDALARALKPAVDSNLLPAFPFGSDFTEIERILLPALQILKSASMRELAVFLVRGLSRRTEDQAFLDRLQLAQPRKPYEWLYATLVRGALGSRG